MIPFKLDIAKSPRLSLLNSRSLSEKALQTMSAFSIMARESRQTAPAVPASSTDLYGVSFGFILPYKGWIKRRSPPWILSLAARRIPS